MSYDAYKTIFIIAAVVAGILAIIAIILFFTFKIPKVIGDLTGSNAKRAIASIKEKNVTVTNKKQLRKEFVQPKGPTTEKLSAETELLSSGEETELLVQPVNTVGIENDITFIHTEETI